MAFSFTPQPATAFNVFIRENAFWDITLKL